VRDTHFEALMQSNRSLAARTHLSPWSGDRDEKPPTVGMVPFESRVNFDQLARQTKFHEGVYEKNVPHLKTSPHDLALYPWQAAFVVKGTSPSVNGENTGYAHVQTSLNGFKGLPNEDLNSLYEELKLAMPNQEERAQMLVVSAIQARTRFLGVILETTPFVDEKGNPRKSNNVTSVLARGLIGQYNLTNKPFEVGQSVIFRPMTFDEASKPSNTASFKAGTQPMNPFSVGFIATTQDYMSLTERQQQQMQLYLRDTSLYMRLFNVSYSRVARSELLACEQVARGQIMQGLAMVGGLMDAGILRLNALHSAANVQAQMEGAPHERIAAADWDSVNALEARSDTPDMLMFSKQMLGPFFVDENGRAVLRGNNPRAEIQGNGRRAIGAYKTLQAQIQLAEMLFAITPSERGEIGQFAGVTRDWMNHPDNIQAALSLRDCLLHRMNVAPSNENVQALAHEPGAFRIETGLSPLIDNAGYASSLSSGVRAPDVNSGHGRLLQQAQLAARNTALGHAQIFGSYGVHGVVTQSAPVNHMAHIMLGGGNGRMS
jgi:hypothetical protein